MDACLRYWMYTVYVGASVQTDFLGVGWVEGGREGRGKEGPTPPTCRRDLLPPSSVPPSALRTPKRRGLFLNCKHDHCRHGEEHTYSVHARTPPIIIILQHTGTILRCVTVLVLARASPQASWLGEGA